MVSREIGSIARCCIDVLKGVAVEVYFNSVPEDFKTPSIYFPKPLETESNHTLSSYRVDYIELMKVFGDENHDAYALAKAIVDDIRKNRNIIPLYREDGTITQEYLSFKKLELKEIDINTYQVSFDWFEIHSYNTNRGKPMAKVHIDMVSK